MKEEWKEFVFSTKYDADSFAVDLSRHYSKYGPTAGVSSWEQPKRRKGYYAVMALGNPLILNRICGEGRQPPSH
jgi:hypothetical protein